MLILSCILKYERWYVYFCVLISLCVKHFIFCSFLRFSKWRFRGVRFRNVWGNLSLVKFPFLLIPRHANFCNSERCVFSAAFFSVSRHLEIRERWSYIIKSFVFYLKPTRRPQITNNALMIRFSWTKNPSFFSSV